GGRVAALGLGADGNPDNAPAAVVGGHTRFVERDDEQAILLEQRAAEERRDGGLEPVVCHIERAAVPVAAQARQHVGEVRQRAVREVGGELRERHQIFHLV